MILRRIGNKSKIAEKIQYYFPKHNTYIEPFFGAGGMFFNKPKANYNFLNDLDSEVFNLFQVLIDKKDELTEMFKIMPISEDLWNYWKLNKETDAVKKALRFLLYSNYGYMGKPETIALIQSNTSKILLNNINKTADYLFDCMFTNCCFKDMFNKISFKDLKGKDSAFIYCDPPYLGTTDTYSKSFKEQDSIYLFDVLQATGCKFAMSEFDNPFILNQAKQRGLNVIIIGERINLKNKRTEVLVTNYEKPLEMFDFLS